jgi:hypothetical protein
MTRTPSDITVVVSIEAFPARAVVAVEVADGSEQDRADVTRLIVAHLGTLWTELDDRVRAVEHRRAGRIGSAHITAPSPDTT